MPSNRDAMSGMLYLPGEELVRATVDGDAAEWSESREYVPSQSLIDGVVQRSAALAARDVPVFRFPSEIERHAWARRQPIGRKRAASIIAAALGVSPGVLAAATVVHVAAFAAFGGWVFRQMDAAAAIPQPVAPPTTVSHVTYWRLPSPAPSLTVNMTTPKRVQVAPPRDTAVITSTQRVESVTTVVPERGVARRPERANTEASPLHQEFLLQGRELTIAQEDQRRVEVLVRMLRIVPGARLRVTGAGPAGSPEESSRKGRREAEAFKRLLVEQGIGGDQLAMSTLPLDQQSCSEREPLCVRGRSRVIAELVLPREIVGAPDSGLAGHWEATIEGDSRPFTVTFDFTVRADTVGGSVRFLTLDRSFDIERGMIKGNDVSFIALGLWRGRLDGDLLYLTRELDGGKTQETTARRKPK